MVCGGVHAFNFENKKGKWLNIFNHKNVNNLNLMIMIWYIDIEDAIELGNFDVNIEAYKHLSNECKDLISNLMNLDCGQRYKVDQALNHPWF